MLRRYAYSVVAINIGVILWGAFVRATQLEWMFWDSAYRLERWPI